VRVAEPIALTSIFPYAKLLVRSFHFGDPSHASFNAGILISAFSLSEALTGSFWGSLSDRVGRKPVLLLGCAGTILSLLVLGSSTNFWVALLGRVLGGGLNGNVAVIQSMVGELVKKPEHEPKAYAVMPFVWSIGTTIGPAIGGIFANPSLHFPSVFSKHGLFARFPYLLPNLICGALLLLSILAGYFLLQETHPDLQPRANPFVHDKETVQTPLITLAGASANPEVNAPRESYGTFNQVNIHEEEHWYVNADGSSRPAFPNEKPCVKAFTWQVSMLVIALGIFTYHSMTYDHLLPIFFEDKKVDEISSIAGFDPFHIPGGLGLTSKAVGLILSVQGLIAVFIQGIIFPVTAGWLGIWNIFVTVTTLQPVAYFIVPYLALLPGRLVYPGIYTCLFIRNLLSILAYPVMLILLRHACPAPSVLGKVNGLAASAGAASRTIAPPIAGILYDTGSKIGFSGLAWWGSVLVAMVGVLQLWFVPREKNRNATTIRSPAPWLAKVQPDQEPRDVVRVEVADVMRP
jgi:predicted MFS family arabinose efflux permease